jgi:hypothetical protein
VPDFVRLIHGSNPNHFQYSVNDSSIIDFKFIPQSRNFHIFPKAIGTVQIQVHDPMAIESKNTSTIIHVSYVSRIAV